MATGSLIGCPNTFESSRRVTRPPNASAINNPPDNRCTAYHPPQQQPGPCVRPRASVSANRMLAAPSASAIKAQTDDKFRNGRAVAFCVITHDSTSDFIVRVISLESARPPPTSPRQRAALLRRPRWFARATALCTVPARCRRGVGPSIQGPRQCARGGGGQTNASTGGVVGNVQGWGLVPPIARFWTNKAQSHPVQAALSPRVWFIRRQGPSKDCQSQESACNKSRPTSAHTTPRVDNALNVCIGGWSGE
mmetsp:Transcript_22982/g.49633  ORF Transcript_22982/g.49633 Transcript_22982/m.49633 type:complete len:251 (-) Transcript_22982:200-952(-)